MIKHVLFIFLDGIGLGDDDPVDNPFAAARMPFLTGLTAGRWLAKRPRVIGERASFMPTDACLGVPGRPQSATGQATILTGRNVPQEIGQHYGPKPNPPVRAILAQDNLFKQIVRRGGTAALINAYPPPFFEGIDSGRRLRSAIQQAVHEAGLPLFDHEALRRGEAMSPDWTNAGWREHFNDASVPLYTPYEAGQQLARLAQQRTFTFFSNWVTDVLGHRGPFEDAVQMLETFDGVMHGLLDIWDDDHGVIIVSSDHGNMEDLSIRKHTENDVPTLIVGRDHAALAQRVSALTDLTPVVLAALYGA